MENNIISFGGSMTAQINFSMQQNYVPVFRSMTMTNNTQQELKNVSLRISFEPEFARTFEAAPVNLLPGQPAEISPVSITILADYLFSLTEKLVGSVTIEAVQDGEVIASEIKPIELLAYDQWTGALFMPEMAAAFISPNHPRVQEILSKASLFLQKWTGDPAFDGYQSRNPNIVRQQMGAIYAALQAENIAYTVPPASFETAQRIRTPDSVLEYKAGTCLDLAVLYCSCLEAAGLNPLLFVISGHAFAGCWLENETFADCLQYDVSAVTKRIAKGVNAICAIECTDLVAGKKTDFDSAESHAASHFDKPSDFMFAIDITRTRAGGIRPMPSRVSENGSFTAVDYGSRKRSDITSAPSQIDIIGDNITASGEVTKQMIWERKLLDLSLRNSLLNFRPSALSVQIMTADLGRLEDEMANGETFRIMPVPNDMVLEAADSRIFEAENNKDQITAVAEAEFKNSRLRTYLKESDLEKAMKKLVRQAKVSIEENGANTIYLALGFLRWYETDKSEKARYAPLVLIPVDITRKVQDNSFHICIRDEDTQFNITLLEMLRQFYSIDIQGLDPVPGDENGVDLPMVFSIVRRGVMSKSRWEVEEYAFVGQFSFNRFIMWNDIRARADELAQNKVVASLMSGKTEWDSGDIDMSPLDLDNRIAPADLAVPVAADSSQLAAVYAANSGKSFVLHGPPGSGKSQTITNMIANALHHGKSVLFVAEKMAALEVVEKRLNKIGLAPFCLELHSNKAQKRAVLKQLEETLNIGRVKQPAEYKTQAEKIQKLRSELNDTMYQIHKVRSCGMSLYDAAVRYEQYKAYGGKFSFTQTQLDSMDRSTYTKWHETLESLSAAGREFGDVSETPLRYLSLESCTPDTRSRLEAKLNELKQALSAADEQKAVLCGISGSENMSWEQCRALSGILKDALDDGYILPQIVDGDTFELKKAAADKAADSGKELSALRAEISEKFENTAFGYDSGAALVSWKTAQGKWFLPKAMKTKKLVAELSAHAKSPGTVTKENITSYYDKLNRIKELSSAVSGTQDDIRQLFGSLWNGEDTDWEQLSAASHLSQKLRSRLSESGLSPAERTAVANELCSRFSTSSQKQSEKAGVQKTAGAFDRVLSMCHDLTDSYSADTDSLLSGENWTAEARQRADEMISALPQLKEWTGIVTLCNKLREYGLDGAADSYLSGRVKNSELVSAFDSDLSRALVTSIISSEPVLSKFQGTLFDDTIRRYNETLESFSRLTINELVAELSANVPAPGAAAASSETGILQKAIKSGGRMMSIRKLFDSIPNLLRRMCPVMLMSPISVAQYIDPKYPKFDLVIFDEASQLPTSEAVGAIARGENVIVVGDPKQLPPTSFFSASTVDEENYEKEDLESVLDDCLALSMPQQHLKWHYRSQHESLIAYSNAKYYENKLYTFPSPDDQVSKVSWVHVDGFYDKSSTRTNKAEAQAVVNEITRRLEDPQLRKLSIGVVTFSLPQQNLVDDLLTDAFRARPELETWANEQYEPIIIKNLENVQGDERDVILFTVGYGPDKEGKVSMNFGPLNRDGGWRRLNVAISRSKCEMIVFSVITPDMIDLGRTRSDGVEGLKGFLEFAAKGKSALAVRGSTSSEGSGFEAIVAEELRKRGYTANCRVGCSDYRIDVAVANPDKPDTYIMAISCCGKSWYESATAKDRHISQAGVLQGLGWNTTTVYLLDWLDNKEKVMSKLEAAINNALELYRHPEAAKKEEEKPKTDLVFETEEISGLIDRCGRYTEFKVTERGSSDSFNDMNDTEITAVVREILAAEAPISRSSLNKKLFACYGITRPGAAMKTAADNAVKRAGAIVTSAGETEFLWAQQQDPGSYSECRAVYEDGAAKRTADEIAPEELAAGIRLIMSEQVSMLRDDLIRETAHLFSITRVTDSVTSAVSLGIRAAKLRGWIAFGEDGKVTYTEDK
ncbi:MAG: DUF3320 domain-containing protein [Ruminococcus sp.]|nr:DUF3320 domain-containing protein [Ruminococcus sp.]